MLLVAPRARRSSTGTATSAYTPPQKGTTSSTSSPVSTSMREMKLKVNQPTKSLSLSSRKVIISSDIHEGGILWYMQSAGVWDDKKCACGHGIFLKNKDIPNTRRHVNATAHHNGSRSPTPKKLVCIRNQRNKPSPQRHKSTRLPYPKAKQIINTLYAYSHFAHHNVILPFLTTLPLTQQLFPSNIAGEAPSNVSFLHCSNQ